MSLGSEFSTATSSRQRPRTAENTVRCAALTTIPPAVMTAVPPITQSGASSTSRRRFGRLRQRPSRIPLLTSCAQGGVSPTFDPRPVSRSKISPVPVPWRLVPDRGWGAVQSRLRNPRPGPAASMTSGRTWAGSGTQVRMMAGRVSPFGIAPPNWKWSKTGGFAVRPCSPIRRSGRNLTPPTKRLDRAWKK
jgi:hypothetical protein